MIKQAIIVAGGLGKRMGELTRCKPKCLLEVSGYPILRYVVDSILEIGIEKIIMDVSEKWSGEIEECIQKYYPSLKAYFSYSPHPRGVGYSIYNTRNYVDFDEPTLITVSDVICFDGYGILEQALCDSDLVLGVSSYPLIRHKKYTRAYIDKNNRLHLNNSMIEPNQTHPLIGVYALKPLNIFFDHLSSVAEALDKNTLSKDELRSRNIIGSNNELRLSFVFELLNRGQHKTVLANLGRCCEINTPNDLISAEKCRN